MHSIVAEAAWIGTSIERPGPTPIPSNGTDGAPAELPAFSLIDASVNGKRFSTLRVVLPTDRLVGLTVTNAEARAWSRALAIALPSKTASEELSMKAALP